MHTLAFKIDHAHQSAGWIKCELTIDGVKHPLDASYAFPPFQPLLRFVKAAAGQRFPARFFWDEEGQGANFEASAVAEDSPLMHLVIKHDDLDEPWFDDVIERETVIQAFLPPILEFSKKYLLSEKQWYLPKKLVAKFQHDITSGIPLRSDIHSPQPVTPSIEGGYDIGALDGRVFFRIVFEEDWIVSIVLFDTNPFWGQLIEFMGMIASGNLPAGCEHLHVMRFNTPLQEEPAEFRSKTRLAAEPLEAADNFRLKIFTQWQEEAEFLLLDEVVDRRQFTSGFAGSFRKFLKKEYRVEPDRDGKTFDLRTLSLETLDQA
jgi:hypothetical protein